MTAAALASFIRSTTGSSTGIEIVEILRRVPRLHGLVQLTRPCQPASSFCFCAASRPSSFFCSACNSPSASSFCSVAAITDSRLERRVYARPILASLPQVLQEGSLGVADRLGASAWGRAPASVRRRRAVAAGLPWSGGAAIAVPRLFRARRRSRRRPSRRPACPRGTAACKQHAAFQPATKRPRRRSSPAAAMEGNFVISAPSAALQQVALNLAGAFSLAARARPPENVLAGCGPRQRPSGRTSMSSRSARRSPRSVRNADRPSRDSDFDSCGWICRPAPSAAARSRWIPVSA